MSTTRSSRKCADTCATVLTPLRSRSGSGRTRCGSLRRRGRRQAAESTGYKAWNKAGRGLEAQGGESDGGVVICGELKDAVSAVTAILAQHFPEGPKGAARAHRQFVRWLGGDMGAQTPGTARWAAAFRDIGRLERNPAKPNYLAEVCPCEGIDFSEIGGRGPDLRGRAAAHAKAKVWSSLSWSTMPDGGLILSKSGQPVARLTPDQAVKSWTVRHRWNRDALSCPHECMAGPEFLQHRS